MPANTGFRHGELQTDGWNRAAKSRLGRSLYLPLFVGEYRPRYLSARSELRLQLRHSLDSTLDLNLDLNLYPRLNHALLATLFETLIVKMFASSFGSMLVSMLRSLRTTKHRALCRQGLRGRRPGGKPPHGRIVVRTASHRYMWYVCAM